MRECIEKRHRICVFEETLTDDSRVYDVQWRAQSKGPTVIVWHSPDRETAFALADALEANPSCSVLLERLEAS